MTRIDHSRWHLKLKDSYENFLREERSKSRDAEQIESYYVSPNKIQFAAVKAEFFNALKEYIDLRISAGKWHDEVAHALRKSVLDDAFRRFLVAAQDEQFDDRQKSNLVDCFWRVDAWVKADPDARATLKRTWNKLKRQYGVIPRNG